MYTIIQPIHSYLAFAALALLAAATINGIIGSTSEKSFEANHLKINKFALIEDIFGVIRILLSLESNYITGCTYIVDGGQTKKF